jgi:iron-sulfur cluster assembly accessory protein
MNAIFAYGSVGPRARAGDRGKENPVRGLGRTITGTRRRVQRIGRAQASPDAGVDVTPSLDPITLTDGALAHLKKLGTEKAQNPIVLRVGVRSGGCSGMSYAMDFVEPGSQRAEGDIVVNKGEVEVWIDPKSLLYLFGLQLDYSDELIGGGFKFSNPNASTSCGCGTSFSV